MTPAVTAGATAGATATGSSGTSLTGQLGDAAGRWADQAVDVTSGFGSLVLGAALVGVAAVMAGAVIASALPSATQQALGRIETIRAGERPPAAEAAHDAPLGVRVLDPILRGVVGAARALTPQAQQKRISRRLELAGSPTDWNVDRVLALQVLATIVLASFGFLVGRLLSAGDLRTALLTVLGLAAGWMGPSAYVSRMASTRSRDLQRELPDSIDLLTISVEAGLTFDAGLARVAQNGKGPTAREFARVLQEIQIGTGRQDALRAMGDRTDVPELRTFAAALIQAETFGIPMANALRIQSDEMRVRRRQRAEESAQKVPVKILFPLIFGILPVLFLVIIGPAAITAFRAFTGAGV